MIRVCEHIFRTNFVVLSAQAKLIWYFAAAHADQKGIVHINLHVLPRLAGLNESESEKVLEELAQHNFYDDDKPPFLAKHEYDNWCVSKVLLWNCSQCGEAVAREFIPASVRQEVLSTGMCAHCSSPENLEVDHIRPVSLGGSSERDNLQPLCGTCNRSKRNRFVG